jgi:hypothetical protein
MHGSTAPGEVGNISRNTPARVGARKNINLFDQVASMARRTFALFCVINLIQFVRLSGASPCLGANSFAPLFDSLSAQD